MKITIIKGHADVQASAQVVGSDETVTERGRTEAEAIGALLYRNAARIGVEVSFQDPPTKDKKELARVLAGGWDNHDAVYGPLPLVEMLRALPSDLPLYDRVGFVQVPVGEAHAARTAAEFADVVAKAKNGSATDKVFVQREHVKGLRGLNVFGRGVGYFVEAVGPQTPGYEPPKAALLPAKGKARKRSAS